MTIVKAGTKMAQQIMAMFNSQYFNKGDIFSAYNRPSDAKIRAYKQIEDRAFETPGYNHDLRVTGASSHFFSTMYSFTDEQGARHIIYDTPSYTRELVA